MAIELFDGLWKLVEPFIPIAKAKRKGEDRAWRTACLTGIVFVLRSGIADTGLIRLNPTAFCGELPLESSTTLAKSSD
jgi:hypothetical protein